MSLMGAYCVRPRKSYQKIKPSIEYPYLIEVQKKSYGKFLQFDIDSDKREDVGLQAVFNSIFPIHDFSGAASVEFVSYSFEETKFSENECRQRGMSFAAPLKVLVRLVLWDTEQEVEEGAPKVIKDVKEQEVYFGELPLMTENGTFVINGTERVVVSQLHRSAGVFFDHDKGKTSGGSKVLYTARVIPYRGSWLDFEFDSKDLLHVRIDRRRKMPVTILLKALGYTSSQLLERFYKTEKVKIDGENAILTLDFNRMRGQRAAFDIVDPKTGDVIIKRGRRISLGGIKKLNSLGIETQSIAGSYLLGKVTAHDILSEEREVLIPANTELEEAHIEELESNNIGQFEILCIDGVDADASLRNTLLSDKVDTQEEALIEIYKRLRPGDPPSAEQAQTMFHNLFFNADRYNLGVVGRHKLNQRLGSKEPIDNLVLTESDIMLVVSYILKLKVGDGFTDDIDHLGNRRVRAVGELLENQYRIGLLRIERVVKERLQLQDVENQLPYDFINNKPAAAVVKEFFGSSQLSQFMDQTNPLSEVTHKRRLSALGPGGLSRERAGFEVRDVHPTHYGRICPVETPEGPNIGLISSLASYATINRFGFIETPYKRVKESEDGSEKVGSVRYYTSSEEDQDHVVAQASDAVNDGKDLEGYISARRRGETETVQAEEADLADVASSQLVSVAANLIPFLQNDDANRALMGSNMMRQAVPLIKTRSPLVGTGMERVVAADSGACVVAKRSGAVVSVDASRIVVKVESKDEVDHTTEVGADVDIYTLKKYSRSNLDTCINQKPIVKVGDQIEPGAIIADGFATELGELALGQNVRVAFMPWNGYNFEDSILMSERVVKEDLYTSVHIQEFECISRDTKLGQEEITADIPNTSEEALMDLDDAGIIRVGAEVSPDDILVGKITPKGETQLSPEEKLLRAIFGEKAGDVRDTSLRVPPGVNGVVIGCKVFSRAGADVDSRSVQIGDDETKKLKKDENDKIQIIKESAKRRILQIAKGEKISRSITNKAGETLVEFGAIVSEELLDKLPYVSLYDLSVMNSEKAVLLGKVLVNLQEKINQIKHITTEMINKITKGDELPPGVIKMVKVFVAIKRKLRVGDKMAGRHGNKGVISRILPEQDMPFAEDGVPVDIVLNPLGVPSRMNVGQILETHLGWASLKLGEKLNKMIAESFDRQAVEKMCLDIWEEGTVTSEVRGFIKSCTDDELKDFVRKYKEGVHFGNPVFDGANEEEILRGHELAGINKDLQTQLYDGLTGEKFHHRVTVGVMYILKLHHLVDEKIHARSIGPYSLVTQQPLGGKAQFGGQRLGEMEVWAMEAYGAAHTLQEMLTVKSDDVQGRTRMYESIVKGTNVAVPGIPESFNVLVKELQSLSMDISLVQKKSENKELDLL